MSEGSQTARPDWMDTLVPMEPGWQVGFANVWEEESQDLPLVGWAQVDGSWELVVEERDGDPRIISGDLGDVIFGVTRVADPKPA
jgi:hypothetical protein